MIRSLLPFEAAFRRWLEARGGRWDAYRLAVGPGGATTTAFRLTPSGPVRRCLVTLHGAGNDALFGWVDLFKRLLQDGTRIIAFDLPGHGRGNDTRFSPALATESVRTVLDALGPDCRDRPVHAVGVSLGGAVLLRSLTRLQDRLATATLIVAPLRIRASPSTVINEFRPRIFRMLWGQREHYGLAGLLPSFGPFKREAYPLRLATDPPPGPFGYIAALNHALGTMELVEAASEVHIPVLVIAGGRDRVVPFEQAREVAANLQNGSLLQIRRGTHLSTPMEPEATEGLVAWIGENE